MEGLDRYGYGMASVRFICGTQDVYKELDKAIQVFHKLGEKYELTQ